MQLTKHGAERVLGRTKMHPDDVLSIARNRAAVDLGLVNKQRYFLFYSPFDRCTKIALVSEDLAVLVSIWEKDYHCPRGVQTVTKALEEKARDALRRFLFSRCKTRGPIVKPSSMCATIRVYVGSDIVYERDGGEVLLQDVKTLDTMLKALMPVLAPIVTLVEANKKESDGRIRYFIGISDAKTLKPVKHDFIRHNNIMKRMTQPPG